mgnify:CR=1 FL=1
MTLADLRALVEKCDCSWNSECHGHWGLRNVAVELIAVAEALTRLGDWRMDKARQHVESLRRFAQSKEDHDFLDRFSGWLIHAKETIDTALAALDEALRRQG